MHRRLSSVDTKETAMSPSSEYTYTTKDSYPLTTLSSKTGTVETNNHDAASLSPSNKALLQQDPDPTEVRGRWKHLFAFTRWSHTIPLIAAIFATVLVAGLKTTLAVFLGKTFNVMAEFGSGAVNGSDTLHDMTKWCFVMLGIGAGNWLANMGFLALWIVFGELQAHGARQDLFDALLWKEMSWFDLQEQGISSLLVRLQTQTRELQLATSQIFGLLLSDVFTSLGSLGIAFYYSWKLTLVLIATLPLSAVILSIGTRKLQPAIQAQRASLATASQLATASITAIDIVKVFGGNGQELWQYYKAISQAAKHYLLQAASNSFQLGYVSFWVVAMFVVGFIYGVALVNQGGISPGSIVTTFYATLASIQGVEAVMPHWLVLAKGMSAGAFLSTLTAQLRGESQVRSPSGSIKPEHCAGDVEVIDVSFAYPAKPETTVLQRSSLYFPAGDMTFIVGQSGSGKSTLGSLIANLYRPLTGDILIDGHSTKVLDADWLQSNVTLIQQTSNLFHESFFRNVALGSPKPDDVKQEEVVQACDDAYLQSTIASLPQRLETFIGPGAHELSGGQKQRVALARARLRDPPILILDEVTSGLDPVCRTKIMTALRKWRHDKTTIIITHDVTQIDDNDFVYVMERAAVAQKGFRRDLAREESGPFAAYSDAACNHPQAPIEIKVSSPDTPTASPVSSFRSPPPGRLARFTQGLLDPLEGNPLHPGQPGQSKRSSLVIAADYALGFQAQTYDPYVAGEHSRQASLYEDIDLETEKRRFSRFVSDSFSLPARGDTKPGDMLPSTAGDRNLGGKRISKLIRDATPEFSERPNSVFGTLSHAGGNTSCGHDHVEAAPASKEPLARTPTERPVSLAAIFRTVWPSLGFRDRLTLIFGVLLCIVAGAAMPAFSYCFARLIEVMWLPGDKLALGKPWALYIVIIAVADGAGNGGGRYFLEVVGQSWINSIRMEALKRILRQPKSWFDHKQNSAGRINECLDRNAEETRNLVGKFIPIVVTVSVMLLSSVTWALIVSWKLTLVALSPLPLIMGAVKGYSVVSGTWEAKCNTSAEEASAVLTEIMLNIRVVRALTLERVFGQKYRRFAAVTLQKGFRRGWWSSPLYGMYNSMNYVMTALVFYYGALLMTEQSELSVSQVLQVVNLLMFGIGTATGLLGAIPQLIMAQATAGQLLGYYRLPLELLEGDTGSGPNDGCSKDLGGSNSEETQGDQGTPGSQGNHGNQDQIHHHRIPLSQPLPITMSHLRFSYRQGGRQVLSDVTLRIDPGLCTTIVGPSGCGKSTVVSLLLGLYAPTVEMSDDSGLSRRRSPLDFAGIPHWKTDVEHLRSVVAYVSQTPFLFPASIADNIAYGIPEASPYRQLHIVARAAEAAGLHDFVASLPEGYATIVGEGGQALSGGQAQRVSIARALIRQPRLLVLDEPTSALDADAAELIKGTLRELIARGRRLGNDMAIVLVTHSRDMMTVADRIVVMEAGRTVEEGSYQELWSRGGLFRHLVSGGANGRLQIP